MRDKREGRWPACPITVNDWRYRAARSALADPEAVLTFEIVQTLFDVQRLTIERWAKAGLIKMGGDKTRRTFDRDSVWELLGFKENGEWPPKRTTTSRSTSSE